MFFFNIDSNLLAEADRAGVIDNYNYFQGKFINSRLFRDPKGIHGVLHTKRVLLLSSILSHLEKLPDGDRNILTFSSLYHDIGRTNDYRDDNHGIKSLKKIQNRQLLADLDLPVEDGNIIKSIICNHPLQDEIGIANIRADKSIKGKARAIRLYRLFKDCDGLDRVRIGDLNIRYLRNETAKKLPVLAGQLLETVK